MTISIQRATGIHLDLIYGLDPKARSDAARRDFIQRSVSFGNCYIGSTDDQSLIAYGILEYSFFSYGFIPLVHIGVDYRRQGHGLALMKYLESYCRTAKLFTSTNLSNIPMQMLLRKLAYKLSGVINDLDENDPELIYCKAIRVVNIMG
jgi:ribosomal protein S18 acetylase RimI-like enzyme